MTPTPQFKLHARNPNEEYGGHTACHGSRTTTPAKGPFAVFQVDQVTEDSRMVLPVVICAGCAEEIVRAAGNTAVEDLIGGDAPSTLEEINAPPPADLEWDELPQSERDALIALPPGTAIRTALGVVVKPTDAPVAPAEPPAPEPVPEPPAQRDDLLAALVADKPTNEDLVPGVRPGTLVPAEQVAEDTEHAPPLDDADDEVPEV